MRGPRIFGPLLYWELARAIRRPRFFLARMTYATSLACALVLANHAMIRLAPWASFTTIERDARHAHWLFIIFGCIQLACVFVLSLWHLSPVISSERERRTLEPLLATDLTDREIVLGKWSGQTLAVATVFVSGAPVLGAITMLGGVAPAHVLVLTILTLTSLVAISAVFTLASTFAKSTKATDLGNAAVILLYLVPGIPLLTRGLLWVLTDHLGLAVPGADRMDQFLEGAFDVLGRSSPFLVFLDVGAGLRWTPVSPFEQLLWGTGFHLLIAAVALTVSIRGLRHTLDATGTTFLQRMYARVRSAREIPPVRPDVPLLWKEWHFEDGVRNVQIRWRWLYAAGFVLGFGIVLLEQASRFLDGRPFGVNPYFFNVAMRVILLILVIAIAFGVTKNASGSIARERNQGTWSSLLCTPLVAREILEAKRLGAMKQVWQSLVIGCGTWSFAIVIGAMSPLAVPVVAIGIAVVGLTAAVSGMVLSLKMKSIDNSTLIECVAIGLVIGAIMVVLVLSATATNSGVGRGFDLSLLFWACPPVAAFLSEEINDPYFARLLITGLALWSALAVVAWLLWRYLLGAFDRLVERTDGVDRRSPRCVPEHRGHS